MACVEPLNGQLEAAIGREVREFRKKLDMTVAELAGQAEALRRHAVEDRERHDLAVAGHAAGAVAGAACAGHRLLPPLRGAARRRPSCGPGRASPSSAAAPAPATSISCSATRGAQAVAVEPYLITLTEESDVFPIFQHAGRRVPLHAGRRGRLPPRRPDYPMQPGDSCSSTPTRRTARTSCASCRSASSPSSATRGRRSCREEAPSLHRSRLSSRLFARASLACLGAQF